MYLRLLLHLPPSIRLLSVSAGHLLLLELWCFLAAANVIVCIWCPSSTQFFHQSRARLLIFLASIAWVTTLLSCWLPACKYSILWDLHVTYIWAPTQPCPSVWHQITALKIQIHRYNAFASALSFLHLHHLYWQVDSSMNSSKEDYQEDTVEENILSVDALEPEELSRTAVHASLHETLIRQQEDRKMSWFRRQESMN